MSQEPVCIRHANTIEEAEVIVGWLEDHGIQAQIPDRDNPNVFAFGVTDVEGVEIFVADEETAERARTLLIEHDKEHDQAANQDAAANAIEVTCSECSRVTSFQPDKAGSVQQCTGCNAYLDVPRAEGPPPSIE